MNCIKATITEVVSKQNLSLVKLVNSKLNFTAIVIDDVESAPYLRMGNEVNVLFKETEVIISKDLNPQISIQNRIACTIKNINMGDLLCELTLETENFIFQSIITRNAAEKLALKKEDTVLALIKTNEISLAPIND